MSEHHAPPTALDALAEIEWHAGYSRAIHDVEELIDRLAAHGEPETAHQVHLKIWTPLVAAYMASR